MKRQRLPDTDSIEELAKFWDAHDLTDFEQVLEEVGKPVFVRRKSTSLSIDLRPKEVQRVKSIALSKGFSETTMLRGWILERLRESSASGRSRRSGPQKVTRKTLHG
jgi:hypothetical protein